MASFGATLDFDTSEVRELIFDLGRVESAVNRALHTVGEDWSEDLEDHWRDNAVLTARRHGKHYPKRVDHEQIGFLRWEIGPEGHPQGEMSFEFGSRNQPPHLDGGRALDAELPHLVRRVGIAAENAFRGA